MWRLSENGLDTLRTNLALFAVDVFYDAPIDEAKGNAITAYASYSINDYGKNYVRNIGPMNPANRLGEDGSFQWAGQRLPYNWYRNHFLRASRISY